MFICICICICICITVCSSPQPAVCLSRVLESQTQLGADLEPRPTLILTPPTIHYHALRYITLHWTTSLLDYITLDYTGLHYTPLCYTPLCYTGLHWTTLNWTTKYKTTSHSDTHSTDYSLRCKPLLQSNHLLFINFQTRWHLRGSGYSATEFSNVV